MEFVLHVDLIRSKPVILRFAAMPVWSLTEPDCRWHSERLDSEAIVEFVRALCAIATEELRPASPRVYSLTKIVEIAHFNMNRIRCATSCSLVRTICDEMQPAGLSDRHVEHMDKAYLASIHGISALDVWSCLPLATS